MIPRARSLGYLRVSMPGSLWYPGQTNLLKTIKSLNILMGKIMSCLRKYIVSLIDESQTDRINCETKNHVHTIRVNSVQILTISK